MSADREQIHPETVEAWRSWLAAHHATSSGVWCLTWKTHTGKPRLTYEEAVMEALAYGWVDSRAGTIDGDRSKLWYCPRRPASGWSRPNKERIARLEGEGRMAAAGARTVAVAKESGAWSLLDDVEALVVPADLAVAFAAHPGAAGHWESFPRSVKRGILAWIVDAKRPETRARRVLETAELAGRGERAHQTNERRRPTQHRPTGEG